MDLNSDQYQLQIEVRGGTILVHTESVRIGDPIPAWFAERDRDDKKHEKVDWQTEGF